MTFSVTCCTMSGMIADASARLRACSRRATSFQFHSRSSNGRNARCTIAGRVTTRAVSAVADAARFSTPRIRCSVTIAIPANAPGTSSRVVGGVGSGVCRSPGCPRASSWPAARRASPSAPNPTFAPFRSTSPALGGAAGTGCAFGTTLRPPVVTPSIVRVEGIETGMRLILVGLLAVFTVASGLQAGAATVDSTPVRKAIAKQVGATYPGLEFGNVACPDGVTRRRNVRFMCTVQLPGTFLFVEATQTDGNGTVAFETIHAVLERQALEGFVAANASLPATVTCGATAWLVARPGQVVTCHAAITDGSQRDVQVTVRDTAGDVTITGVT